VSGRDGLVRTDRSLDRRRSLLITACTTVAVVAGVGAIGIAVAQPSATTANRSSGARSPAPSPVGALEPRAPIATEQTDAPSTVEAPPPATTTTHHTSAVSQLTRPGVPVRLDISIPSANHPHGVHTAITSHHLNPDGTLFVPDDPTEVAWARDDVAPGSPRGTAILVSHINYVINGQTVAGAFADLAEYGQKAVGRHFRVHLADGRTLVYQILFAREYHKEQLAAQPQLRRLLYDQTQAFGRGTGRLLLVSCGGPFDPNSGEYEDNVFLYALPVAVG
jgi:hypothetical protein